MTTASPEAGMRESVPACRSYLAEALHAQTYYFEALDDWNEWLTDPARPTNASKLVLWQLIEDTIEKRRKPGGAWADADELPSAETLKALLGETYQDFRLEVKALRDPIEATAHGLITILDSVELRAELDGLPHADQVRYINTFLHQLSSSNVGMLYLRRSVCISAQPPLLPIFHPSRAFTDVFLEDVVPNARRTSRLITQIFFKLLPAATADREILHRLSRPYLTMVLDPNIFTTQTIDIRLLVKERDKALKAQWDAYKAKWGTRAALVTSVFEVATAVIAFQDIRDDPSPKNNLRFGRALVGVAAAVESAQREIYAHAEDLLAPATRRLIAFNSMIVVLDIVIAARDGWDAWETGDVSVAAGNALQGVGSVAGTVASSALALKLVPTLYVPVLNKVVVASFAVALVGTAVITFTADPPMETWFECNYFGSNWDGVDGDETPLDPRFGFLDDWIDEPNLERQISEYLSMLYPIGLTVERYEGQAGAIKVTLRPSLAYHESEVVVARIDDRGWGSDPPRFVMSTLYSNKINVIPDIATSHWPRNPGDDDVLQEWSTIFLAEELPAGSHVEVSVKVPPETVPSLSGFVFDRPETLRAMSFVLRGRAPVPLDL
ncbi:MAG TPA: hypothetical protein VK988_06025 [Acidimicrobiales bacterium]|nr:hypothetical protein [Acidimicrobiales bacterium]